ncbi:META domain-containing protein [Alloalcanivorax mobilis]|uniref:META domain-containing protein n=1 Tax=Alloalcanivorax mobilis TaxID=2019569 RepID=UPI000C774981|nr:META domain-containing protein [Alloalcanivorax mobilis]
MKSLWLALPLALFLGACDDADQSGQAHPDQQAEALQKQEPVPQQAQRSGLQGIWQPVDTATGLDALILEQDGHFYVIGDQRHRGVNWEAPNDTKLTLHYLGGEQTETLTDDQLSAGVDGDTLNLEGESPFAGAYRRDNSGIGSLQGTVVLPADVGVPDNAVLALTLQDVSQQQTTAEVVAQRLTRLRLEGLRMPFQLYFNEAAIQAGHQYTVSARVIADGAVHFTTTTAQPVLDDAHQAVTLALQPATRAGNSYLGRFVYQPDNATFTTCGGDQRFKVAGPRTGDMQKAYLDARQEPLAPVVMQVTGEIEKRDGAQSGTTEATLVVQSFRVSNQRVDCDEPTASLTNTYWKLMHLDDQPVPAPQHGESEPHLILGDKDVKGSTGCNRLSGEYQRDGDRLALDKLASTRRACVGPNVAEEFVDSLNKTDHFNLQGQRLSLYDGDDHLLAVFQAQYL